MSSMLSQSPCLVRKYIFRTKVLMASRKDIDGVLPKENANRVFDIGK